MKYIILTKNQIDNINEFYKSNSDEIVLQESTLGNGDRIKFIAKKDIYNGYTNIRLFWASSNDLEKNKNYY